MFFRLDLTKPIQVKTGDYRQKWTDAKILNIGIDVHQYDDNAWVEMNANVEFIEGEDRGSIQHINDLKGLYGEVWRYKEDINRHVISKD